MFFQELDCPPVTTQDQCVRHVACDRLTATDNVHDFTHWHNLTSALMWGADRPGVWRRKVKNTLNSRLFTKCFTCTTFFGQSNVVWLCFRLCESLGGVDIKITSFKNPEIKCFVIKHRPVSLMRRRCCPAIKMQEVYLIVTTLPFYLLCVQFHASCCDDAVRMIWLGSRIKTHTMMKRKTSHVDLKLLFHAILNSGHRAELSRLLHPSLLPDMKINIL